MMNEHLKAALERNNVRVERQTERKIATPGKLDMAYLDDRLTFVTKEMFLAQAVREPGISALIVPPALAAAAAQARPDWWVLVHEDPLRAFWRVHLHLVRETPFYGRPEHRIDPSARVDPRAVVHEGVTIGPNCSVEAFAVLYPGTVLGARVTIGNHSVIGREGFESLKLDDVQRHIDHAGGVVIGDDVGIMSGVHVDRAIWGMTKIGRGTQIDNMSHVAHGCVLGENNVLAAAVIIGGVVKVGSDNFFGMNCTIKHNISIGSRCRIAMGAAILQSIADETKIMMMPAMTDRDLLAKMRAEYKK
jgi:UDP-3-O-[3-hydroxymyristoyl] glucosamine N-acyltransferase